MEKDEERDQYFGSCFSALGIVIRKGVSNANKGLSLREFVHEFKYQTLVLFKCCLLQPKVCQLKYLNIVDDEG